MKIKNCRLLRNCVYPPLYENKPIFTQGYIFCDPLFSLTVKPTHQNLVLLSNGK